MNRDPIVFAMANPNPEVAPEEALPVRADHRHRAARTIPNQINNVLGVPGRVPRRARRPRATHHRGR